MFKVLFFPEIFVVVFVQQWSGVLLFTYLFQFSVPDEFLYYVL